MNKIKLDASKIKNSLEESKTSLSSGHPDSNREEPAKKEEEEHSDNSVIVEESDDATQSASHLDNNELKDLEMGRGRGKEIALNEDAPRAALDYKLIQRMIDTDSADGSQKFITNEDELEDFIVLKAIRDVQMPRLALEDQAVFLNILNDMFPGTPKPKLFQEISLRDMFPDQ